MNVTVGESVVNYHFQLKPTVPLPKGIDWIMPFEDDQTKASMQSFYSKFYADSRRRYFIFGINPGRFGAGITGIAFTDPVKLEEVCGIQNDFKKRAELSSNFVYECISEMGGAEAFYAQFYITSLCPLGFIKEGKNYNFYDDRQTEASVTPFIIENIDTQLSFGGKTNFAFCMGQGKNYKYFLKLNQEHRWFDEIIPLPHPRWIMQYRLKRKEEFLKEYVDKFHSVPDI